MEYFKYSARRTVFGQIQTKMLLSDTSGTNVHLMCSWSHPKISTLILLHQTLYWGEFCLLLRSFTNLKHLQVHWIFRSSNPEPPPSSLSLEHLEILSHSLAQPVVFFYQPVHLPRLQRLHLPGSQGEHPGPSS